MSDPSSQRPADLTPPWTPEAAAAPQPAPEPTQPLDVHRTQQIAGAPGQPSGVQAPEPLGWFYDTAPAAQARPAAPPIDTPEAGPAASPDAHPPRRTRGGPGWLAVIAVAGTLALVAGVAGGGLGAWLANSGRLGFGRTAYEAPTPQPGTTARPQGSVAAIAATALPSVVTIQVTAGAGGDTGSGWVFDTQGHIVTNNHVVEAAADSGKIVVELSDGKRVPATIVGRDSSYDLAVVKVTGVSAPALPLGRSSDVVVGDQVIAVGAPLGLQSTVTMGIVSALNRPVSAGGGTSQSFINAIQTDAAINPGNSGGPLLDMQGRVIGVNSAIAQIPSTSSSQSGNIGVGFAIPSDQVGKTVEQLIRSGKAQHPVIGVLLDTGYDGAGVRVATGESGGQPPITKGGPADKAGLRPGDVIVGFNGRPIAGNDELVVAIRSKSVGDQVTLKVRRDGRTFDVRMTLQGADGQ